MQINIISAFFSEICLLQSGWLIDRYVNPTEYEVDSDE